MLTLPLNKSNLLVKLNRFRDKRTFPRFPLLPYRQNSQSDRQWLKYFVFQNKQSYYKI